MIGLNFAAFAQSAEIKSLKTYINGNETLFPVIVSDGKNSGELFIEFDIASEFEPNLSIIFKFCDRNWEPYENPFLINHGNNSARILNFTNLPLNIKSARYHFKGMFNGSNQNVTFPFSGKWRYFIVDAFNYEKIYGEGKFFVIQNEVELSAKIKNNLLEDKIYFPLELARVYNLKVSFELPFEFTPSFIEDVEIIENRKIEFPFVIPRQNDNYRGYYWDGNQKFDFYINDINPGNEYRQTDLRDPNVFIFPDVNAQREILETTRFFSLGRRDLNGASILMDHKNPEAQYLNVLFKFEPSEFINDDIFVTGAFNNWEVSEKYKLNKNGNIYQNSFQMKRGIYDYQFVTGEISNGYVKNIDWLIFEGNNWQTSKEFYVFLYYNEPQKGGYDKIIGFLKIKSGN